MDKSNDREQGLSIDIGTELTTKIMVHKNMDQEIIVTTEDKLKLILIETKDHLVSKREWWTPIGILVAVITTLCTSDFKDIKFASKDTLEAIFIILLIFCLVWLVRALTKYFQKSKEYTIESIIQKIKLNSK